MIPNAPPTEDGRRTFSVARAIYDACRRAGHRIDVPVLEKLLYLSHGWSLAVTDRALLSEPFVVEAYGPVLISLTRLRRVYERSLLPEHDGDRIFGPDCVPFAEGIPQLEVILRVVDTYAGFTGWRLSALTRWPDGAQERALRDGLALLTDPAIRADFVAMAHAGRAAA